MISQSLGGGDLYELARVVVPTKRIRQYRWAHVFVFVFETAQNDCDFVFVFKTLQDICVCLCYWNIAGHLCLSLYL